MRSVTRLLCRAAFRVKGIYFGAVDGPNPPSRWHGSIFDTMGFQVVDFPLHLAVSGTPAQFFTNTHLELPIGLFMDEEASVLNYWFR